MPTDFHVLIIGGGNCGLAIATGLKKAGIAYTVFERDDEHDFVNKTRDWGMLLHWGTQYLINVLPDHLQKRLKEPRVDPTCEMADKPVPYFNGATGEIIGRVPSDVITRVSRKKLRRFLSEGEDLDIQFGKRLRGLTVHNAVVTAEFENGSQAQGSMAIGVDGSHSKIREFLIGREAAQCAQIGLTMINYGAAGYTPEQTKILRSYHPIVQLAVHPTMRMSSLLAALDVAGDDTTRWRFQNYTSWWGPPYAKDLQDPAAALRFVRDRMATAPDPFRTGWLSLGDDTVLPVDPGQQWAPTMTWDNHGGRVTLAGDAAHSMLPHRGQGLNNAMKDSSDLVDAIKLAVSGQTSLEDSVTAYEAEMRPRGAKEVALSLEQAENSRDWDRFMSSPIFKYGHRRTTE